MKLLWITNKDVTAEPIVNSLDSCAEELNVQVSKKYYNQECSYDTTGYDLVVYMGGAELVTTPKIEIFQKIREKSKLVMICCDATCSRGWGPLLELYHKQECFDFIVNIDGSDKWDKQGKDYTDVTPIDFRCFADAPDWADRNTLFGFSGGINPERGNLIRKVGLMLTVSQRSEAFGSYPGYANFLKNCKFVLNMNERNTVKGRTLEVGFAGACLVEQRASKTDNTLSKWFDEKNYILYDDPEEVGGLIYDYYDKAKDMAKAFSEEVKEKHTAKKFWERLITK